MPPARSVPAGFSPLDDELALLPGSLTPQAAAALVHLGTVCEFTPAAALLADLTGIQVSEPTTRRRTYTAGAVLVAQQTAAAAALAPPADPGPAQPTRLQVSADGAMIALVGGTWAEVRTVVIGEIVSEPQPSGPPQPHARHLSYFSRLLSAEEFTRLASGEMHRRGVRAVAAVAGVMDGALWLQGFLDYHRPDAVRILDVPHAVEHIYELAAALGGPAGAGAEWAAGARHLLVSRGGAALLKVITHLAVDAADGAAYAQQAAYLGTRVAQLNYPAFRAAGWAVGSGIVESGNKVVVERRLKGAGKRWAGAHVNPLLALRNGECNGRWGETVTAIGVGVRAAVAARRAGRVAGRAGRVLPVVPPPPVEIGPPPVNAAVVAEVEEILARVRADCARERAARAPVNGKPAAGHAWRHAGGGIRARPLPAQDHPAKQ